MDDQIFYWCETCSRKVSHTLNEENFYECDICRDGISQEEYEEEMCLNWQERGY